jgi:hypothetical protein
MLWARVVRGTSSTENDDASSGDLLDHFGGTEGAEKTDQELIAPHERKIGFAGDVIGAVAEDLNDDVGGGKYGGAVGENFSALLDVGCVGISSAFARA